METITPGQLRSELLDNCELDLAGPLALLAAIAANNGCPGPCLPALAAAADCLQAAGEHLEAAAAIADGISR